MEATIEFVPPYGEITQTLDPIEIPPGCQRILDAARAEAGDGLEVSYDGLADRLGIRHSSFNANVERLIDWGLWPYYDSGPPAHLAGEIMDPEQIRQIQEEAIAAMVRPTRHAPGRPIGESDADACRRYLREWRRMKRRAKIAPVDDDAPLHRNAPTQCGYLGVYLDDGLYRARYIGAEEIISGQRFDTAEGAARCHDRMARARGETVRLNSNPDPSVKERHYRKRGTYSGTGGRPSRAGSGSTGAT